MRRAMLTAAILACVLGLSACNDDPPGSGNPKTGGSGDTAAPKGGSGKTGTPLAATDPCTLLEPADVPELEQRYDVYPERGSSEHPSCAGYGFAVTIIDNDQLGHEMDFEGSQAQPVPDIAGHHAAAARMQVSSETSCLVSMDVTADEYVRVGVTPHDDPSRACDLAVRAATVVAARIPVNGAG
ncbi:DUF3558 family protein [Amycolatopsis pithecellobii]|uniref:DUF3558 domain-containing protein n=1 Tax=Amycolatopsis pithecellobii TaxID=664692 RepID=A0A6N7Z1C4_9PSEU|nr:DUF3558 family protein [Amycolatopsis pithecellobii]MTD54579.1 DUF3558 domain-containing protein [Amycolatopsis pithecellobii]